MGGMKEYMGLAYCSIIRALKPWYTPAEDKLHESMGGLWYHAERLSYLTRNGGGLWWMDRALYTELSAHSGTGNEEYHFTALASGLVYIMTSMLCEGISRGGNLCIARLS